MNNVELARTLSWRENALFEEQKEHSINTINNLNCTLMKKKLLYLVFVALAAMTASLLSLTSCSKDDDKKDEIESPAELKAKIVGRWKLTFVYLPSGKKIDSPYPYSWVYDFTSDGTMKILSNGEVQEERKWYVSISGKERLLFIDPTTKMIITSISSEEFYGLESDGSTSVYVRVH